MRRTGTGPRFGPLEEEEAERLVQLAILEDLPRGDVTTDTLIPAGIRARAAFVPRQDGVVCGIPVVEKLFSHLEPRIVCRPAAADGAPIRAGEPFLAVEGPARAILSGERSALNF